MRDDWAGFDQVEDRERVQGEMGGDDIGVLGFVGAEKRSPRTKAALGQS
jgi:hypothetical protein